MRRIPVKVEPFEGEPMDAHIVLGENDDPDGDDCDYAGHDWLPAGGGLLICGQCEAEKWDE